MAGEGHARTAVTVHLLTVQQIPHHWLFPAGVQGNRCLTTTEEKWAWHQDELRNYLPFLSKLLEKVVHIRVQAFFNSTELTPKMQSVYWRFHSTETAVTKVFNDLLLAADAGQMSALCLLILTAAFNTVDHELLLLWLEWQFGLHGMVLVWFQSYLSGRMFRVMFSCCMSYRLHCLLGPTGISAGSAAVHCAHSGPRSYSGEARCIFTRICRRHTTVSSLSSCRHCVSCCPTGMVHHSYWPLDVSKPTEAQHRKSWTQTRQSCCGFDRDTAFQTRLLSSNFYRATAKHMHGIAVDILSVCPSVCLSVKRVYCDETKQ